MKYKNFNIESSQNSSWCSIYKDGQFIARTVNMEEARRFIWLALKGTPDEIEYLSEEMMGQ